MKKGCPSHPKTFALAEALGIRRVAAIGTLELLFHFTAQYAPEGDIGRYSDKRIAGALDWRGKVTTLIDSLISTGWVDSHPVARLVLHDWHDHAERYVLQKLSRHGKNVVQPFHEVTGKLCEQTETQNISTRNEESTLPCLAMPSHAMPSHILPNGRHTAQSSDLGDWPHIDQFHTAWRRHLKHRANQPLDVVARVLIGRSSVNWQEIESVHPGYAEYWARRGWDFCSLSFLEWIDAGMPPAPPEPKQQSSSQARFDRLAAIEEELQ